MAGADEIVHKLIETDDPDSPESFDVKGYTNSPLANLAAKNGFHRDDRDADEERWVKKLSNGNEAWLRTTSHRDWEKTMDLRDPRQSGGRQWEFVLVTLSDPPQYKVMANGNEVVLYYLLSAILQRLATWPENVPKPGEPGGKEAFFGEALDELPAPEDEPSDVLPPEDEPSDVLPEYIGKIPDVGPYLTLLRHMRKNELDISGRVTRRSSYVHERSTDFDLEFIEPPGLSPEDEAEIATAAGQAEKLIKEEIISINRKIYRALELEWDYLNSDESVDENIEINDYRFDREGNFKCGRVTFARLNDRAKERARDWYRESISDFEWWDSIVDEWKTEIEEMGFSDVEIAFTGFSSQGDGASFTGKHFDLSKWTNWFFSSKPTEQGHPYTDDLFRKQE